MFELRSRWVSHCALLFGYIAVRLNVSPIIGYLLAGIAVRPFTPGVVVNGSTGTENLSRTKSLSGCRLKRCASG